MLPTTIEAAGSDERVVRPLPRPPRPLGRRLGASPAAKLACMHARSKHAFALAVVLSVLAIVLAPALVIVGLLAGHAASYDGLCGPYPTDIPAHPCDFGTYLVNFFEPFALVGLIVIAVVTVVGALGLVGAAWTLGALVWVVRRTIDQLAGRENERRTT